MSNMFVRAASPPLQTSYFPLPLQTSSLRLGATAFLLLNYLTFFFHLAIASYIILFLNICAPHKTVSPVTLFIRPYIGNSSIQK